MGYNRREAPGGRLGGPVRRIVTFAVVAIATAVGSLYWLYDGDLDQAAEPVMAEWDASALATSAGIPEDE